MFGIDDPTAVATLPTPEAAGTVGFWTEGNPGAGQAATLMRASFFNGLQQELLNILAAASITPSKTTYNQLASAIALIAKGRLINTQVITSTATFTPTSGARFFKVTVVGGGSGGAGSASTSAGQVSAGGGGAGGGFAIGWFTLAQVTGVTATIGGNGAGGGIGAAGGAGGTTSLGSLLSATGGGAPAGGTAASSSTNALSGGSNGGVGTGGYITGVGGYGGASFYALNPVGGAGGASLFGAGASPQSGNTSGASAVSRGAGGAGGSATSGSGGAAGGNGAAGVIIVEEYA